MGGRGKNESHRKKSQEEKDRDNELGVPRISLDYFFLREKGQGSERKPDDCDGG